MNLEYITLKMKKSCLKLNALRLDNIWLQFKHDPFSDKINLKKPRFGTLTDNTTITLR